MLLVDDLAAGGTKNLRHTPRGLVTLILFQNNIQGVEHVICDVFCDVILPNSIRYASILKR